MAEIDPQDRRLEMMYDEKEQSFQYNGEIRLNAYFNEKFNGKDLVGRLRKLSEEIRELDAVMRDALNTSELDVEAFLDECSDVVAVISHTINANFGKNLNDLCNMAVGKARIRERHPEYKHGKQKKGYCLNLSPAGTSR